LASSYQWYELCIHRCMGKTVVVLTSGEPDVSAIIAGAATFGWSVLMLNRLRSLDMLPLDTVSAILFDRDAVGGSWTEATSRLRRMAPKVPLIACHHITEMLDWPAVCDAGAFHGVRVPLNKSELRQSVGYVWAAMQRGTMFLRARPSAAVCIHQTAA